MHEPNIKRKSYQSYFPHTSFAKACIDKIQSHIRKGKSRHELLVEMHRRGKKGKSTGYLHSDSTINTYGAVIAHYAHYIAENHPECKNLDEAHRKKYDKDYVQHRIDDKKAPATIKKETAALAFLHSCTMAEVHNNRPIVRARDARRCRNYTTEKYYQQLAYCKEHNNQAVVDIMRICIMTGVRRDEAIQLRPSNFMKKGGVMFCYLSGNNDVNNLTLKNEHVVWTKGGRKRKIEILPAYTAELESILARYEIDQVICPSIPSRIPIHGIRSMYACELYEKYARPIETIPYTEKTKEKRKFLSSRYYDRQGAIWDRRALLRVSKSLGHDRSVVVQQSYLWRLR